MSIAVVGAGAAGLMAAIQAAEKETVILIDGNDRIGKKIMITGNGKCNYWHEEINIDKYNTSNEKILNSILMHQEEVLKKLDSIGLVPTIKNGCYYPHSETSSSIRALFEYQLSQKNIKTKFNFKVSSISKQDSHFIIKSISGEELCVDKVILSPGSKASPKTGSDGSGYTLAESLGHTINPVYPSLTPLVITQNKKLKWAGIRTQAKISLYIDDSFIKAEKGEVQLTEYGISGICVFNISGMASRAINEKKQVDVYINFLPDIDEEEEYLLDRFHRFPNFTIEKVLESLLHYEIIFMFLNQLHIKLDTPCQNITDIQIKELSHLISNSKFNIVATKEYDRAQVCTGGININEINPKNMESTKTKNLYLAGEILDVDGICGGYNLAFAFITGYLAGKGISHDSN